MPQLPRVRLSSRLARMAYTRLSKLAYRFVDLDVESPSLDSRVIEYSFVISKLARRQKGRVLDVGCTDSGNMVPLVLALLGWEVYGIDTRQFSLDHPNFHFIPGDIRSTSFADGFFDCICAVSTIEHIGLKGRYTTAQEELEGDIKAVKEIDRILRAGGALLVTVPYGRWQLVKPLQRVYDKPGLQNLFSGWRVKGEAYYVFQDGHWEAVAEEIAGEKDYLKGERALALLELSPLK